MILLAPDDCECPVNLFDGDDAEKLVGQCNRTETDAFVYGEFRHAVATADYERNIACSLGQCLDFVGKVGA